MVTSLEQDLKLMTHPLYAQLKRYLQGALSLPTPKAGTKQFFIVPVSSGIDSTAVAILMRVFHPDLPLTFVFTDTGNEVEGTEAALDKLEAFTGQKIIRLRPPRTLLDTVEAQGNYLPSARQRYCTTVAKLKPYQQFIAALKRMHGPDTQFVSFVGVRADEPEREGMQWSDDSAVTVFPLQQWGLDKAAVNELVQEVVGIPTYYAGKSRSGCAICIHSRRSEVISMVENDTATFDQAVRTETMPEDYGTVLKFLPKSVCSMTGVGRNWLTLAIPNELGGSAMAWADAKGASGARNGMSLFGGDSQIYYVAVEHHFGKVDPFAASKEVFFQKFVTFSTSLGGLTTALKHHTLHRYQTKELWGHGSAESLAGEHFIGIYTVELDDAAEHIPVKPEGVYSWQSDGKTLLEVRKVKYLLEQILLTEGLRQESKSPVKQRASEAQKLLSKIDSDYGRVLQAKLYDRPALSCLIDDMDITDGPTVCNACSR